MTLRRSFEVTDDGRIDGLRMIGFEGAVDPASTPSQHAPVLVDAQYRLSRIVDVPSAGAALVDTIEPPLPTDGPLPGVATRTHERPAIVHGVVAIVGKSERPLTHGIPPDQPAAFPRVVRFLEWLRNDLADEDPFEHHPAGIWSAYLTKPERHALWKALHPEVLRCLRDAVREGDPTRMADAAFWLSRVVVDAEKDLGMAAYALFRARSFMRANFMLREGLRLPPDRWDAVLSEAKHALEGAEASPACTSESCSGR